MAARPPIGRSIGSLLPQITKKAFEKFGFAEAAILTDWRQIAGDDVAGYTMPERLRWPKTPDQGERTEANVADGATLVLRVEGPRALEIQHRIPQLMERINRHFGFRAITAIRILQAPLDLSRSAPAKPRPKPAPPIHIDKSEIADEGLRQALEQLGGEVRRANGAKEQ